MAKRKKKRRAPADGPAMSKQRPADAKSRPLLTAIDTARLRPWLLAATVALLVARLFYPSESAADEGDGLPVVMLWIALGVVWLLGAIGRPRFRIRFGKLDTTVILLVSLCTLAALWATRTGSPRPAINMLWEWVGLGAVFLSARQFILGQRETRAVVSVMVAMAVVLSGYGLYQYWYEMPATRAAYQANPDEMLREAGVWYPPGSPQRLLFESRLESAEPIATFALTNSLAGYLAPWLVVLVGIAVAGGFDYRRKRSWLAAVGCALPVVVCLVLTESRSAYVATGVGLGLVWLVSPRLRRRLGWKLPVAIGATVVVLVAVTFAAWAPARQALAGAGKSFGYRLQYWQSTMQLIGDHPWLGCGPGNFGYAYTRYKLPEASEEVADPHNFLLEVWATAGTPAMLVLLGVLGGVAGIWWQRYGRSRNSDDVSPARSIKAATAAGVMAEDETDSPKHVLFGAAAGVLLAVPIGLISAAPPSRAVFALGVPLAVAAVVVLYDWIQHGRLPAWLPGIGVAVLLINLLAAGGITMPSVAGSLWLLAALAVMGDRPRELPRYAAFAALALALGLAWACYRSGYGPVVRCRGLVTAAQQEPQRAEEYLFAAAEADPLDGEPLRQLAGMWLEMWRVGHRDERFEMFEALVAEALRRTPNSSAAWHAAGRAYLEAFELVGRQQDAEKAVEMLRKAVDLYPNSGACRADLALALKASGRQDAFRREADRALELDRLTPHAEKKLPEQLREQLQADEP